MERKKNAGNTILTVLFSVISILYVYPILLVVINSFKKKAYISKKPFMIPQGKQFVGIQNYINGIEKTGLLEAAMVSVFITVLSVFVIILCTSMCAWYITRVHNAVTSGM